MQRTKMDSRDLDSMGYPNGPCEESLGEGVRLSRSGPSGLKPQYGDFLV